MNEFLMKYSLSFLLAAVGVFFVVFNYSAVVHSKKSGHYVSGIPFIGGVLLFFAFIITPLKLLSLTCLLDYSIPMFFVSFVPEMIVYYKESRCFLPVFRKYKYKGEYETRSVVITFGDTSYESRLLYNFIYTNVDTPLKFAICKNKNEPAVIALIRDKTVSSAPEILPFSDGYFTLDDVPYKDTRVKLTVSVKNPR